MDARALPVRLDIAVRTDPGRERPGNEDSYFVAASAGASLPAGGTVETISPGWVALAVCDGMGGAAAGEVASRSAADAIRDHLVSRGPAKSEDELGHRLIAGVESASRRVFEAARADDALSGMGTTATVCVIRGDALFHAQVGDSRAYLLRDGRLTQLTRDQTLARILVEQGQLMPEDLPTFPLGHVILQAVGTAERVEVDLRETRLSRDDVILICSDGLYGPVSDEEIRAILVSADTVEAAAEALVERANAAGGPDNVTCIVARSSGAGLSAAAGAPTAEKARLEPPPIEEDPVVEEERRPSWIERLAALFGGGTRTTD